MSKVALIDGDYLAFAASAACEKMYYTIKCGTSSFVAPNLTELKTQVVSSGHTWDRKSVTVGAIAEPITQVEFCIRGMIDSWVRRAGCTSYKIYLSTYGSFRKDIAISQPYKGNRAGHKPVHLESTKQLLINKFKATNVNNDVIFFGKTLPNKLEADDMLVVEALRLGVQNTVVVTIDKDSLSQPVNTYRLCDDDGVVNGSCLGKLWLNDKGDVKGYGRKFLYYQMLNGDQVDTYKLSQLSTSSFGSKSAYKAIVDCSDDRDCYVSMIETTKRLYPDEFTHTCHNGVDHRLSWLNMLDESLYMAKMVSRVNDFGQATINTGIIDIIKWYKLEDML